jgi:hypothetical protein
VIAEIDPFDPPPQTLDEASEAFRVSLADLQVSQRRFAVLMGQMGDKRPFDTILRSIQRMATQEARVSGEMQVIMTLLHRERRRAQRLEAQTNWMADDRGVLRAQVEGVALTIAPESRGRWSIHARHLASDYSPAIPHWRQSLGEAKLRAILAVEEALDEAATI